MEFVFSPGPQLTEEGFAVPCKWCVGRLRRAPRRRRMRRGGRREPDREASPAGGSAPRQTGSGERRSSRWIRAWPGGDGGNRGRGVGGGRELGGGGGGGGKTGGGGARWVNAASVAHNASACARKRRTQNW